MLLRDDTEDELNRYFEIVDQVVSETDAQHEQRVQDHRRVIESAGELFRGLASPIDKSFGELGTTLALSAHERLTGRRRQRALEARKTLLDALRDELGVEPTKRLRPDEHDDAGN